MSKLTKQQWKEVEEKLKSFWSPVYLDCDGYKVILKLNRIDQFKNAISVYVDDVFKGAWSLAENDDEEAKRFYKVHSRAYYKEKDKKKYIRMFGKKEARRIFNIDARYQWRMPYWKAFSSLKRHFIANNENITLVEKED